MQAPELVLNPRIAQWTVQSAARLLATFAVVQGVAILIGGAIRWSAPAFRVALQLPGAPASWGLALLLSGALALAGSLLRGRRTTVVGMYAIAVWCGFFALAFLGAYGDPHASTTGVSAYGALMVLSILLASAYRASKTTS